MPERVIGYQEVEKEIIVSRPCKWVGDDRGGFQDFKPVTVTMTLFKPIMEDLGSKINTTLEDPIIGIPETPLWGVNTDDATGKHRKNGTRTD